jgi:hypothetical protein
LWQICLLKYEKQEVAVLNGQAKMFIGQIRYKKIDGISSLPTIFLLMIEAFQLRSQAFRPISIILPITKASSGIRSFSGPKIAWLLTLMMASN